MQISTKPRSCTRKLLATTEKTSTSRGTATLPISAALSWITVVARLSDSENIVHGHKPMNRNGT